MSSVDVLAEQILLTPAELAVALAEHEQRAAVLALALAHVHERGDWAGDGAVTMRAWLRDVCRMSDRDASAWVRRSKLLNRFEAIAEAAVTGLLSAGQVGELERLHRSRYEALLAEHQCTLVHQLSMLDVASSSVVCQQWRQRADAILDDGEPPLEPVRELTQTRAADGSLLGRFTLDDAAANEWEHATMIAARRQGDGDTRTLQERQGDAMFDIAAFFNKNHDLDGNPRHHRHLSISVNASTLDDSPEGTNDHTQTLVTPACTDAYLCDCKIHTILRDGHQAPLGFGRTRYVVSRKLFNQVAARDGGCRFPGCDRKVRHCDAHHIRYWRRMGATDYDNLTLLCSRHHHLVHQQHLELKLLPDGELHVAWPDGRERTSRPRGAPPTRGST